MRSGSAVGSADEAVTSTDPGGVTPGWFPTGRRFAGSVDHQYATAGQDWTAE